MLGSSLEFSNIDAISRLYSQKNMLSAARRIYLLLEGKYFLNLTNKRNERNVRAS